MKKTIPGNMLYLLNILWKIDRSTFWSMQLHILLGAIVPFISVLIPSVIINLLLKERSLSTFVFVLGGLLLLYGILQGLVSYLNEYNAFAFIKSRGLYFVRNVYLGRAHLDYALLENEEYKKILEDAVEAIETNNNGQEGMFHDFIIFATSLLGLILYALASSGLSILFVLGLLLLVVLQYALFSIARHYEYSHRPELDGYLIETRYLNQIAYDTAAGKDIRLYQLQDWINDKFEHVNRLIARIRARDYSAYMLVDTLGILLDFVRDIACYAFLILGFYTPSAGSIYINGTNIRELDLDDLYAHITGIFQDAVMLSYSIAENVSMQDITDTDLQRVKDCLKRCGLWNFISALPQQELTHIGKDIEEDGIQLSGGQKQKLFMARALYRDFGCLLLDEPTAALDALAEKAIYEIYHELTQGTSSLFISHRLSSTRFCDEILVLDQGHIVERGSHEELLGKQGIYAAMFQAQSQYYEEEGDGCECMAGN